jgi:hypothetical protein
VVHLGRRRILLETIKVCIYQRRVLTYHHTTITKQQKEERQQQVAIKYLCFFIQGHIIETNKNKVLYNKWIKHSSSS